MSQESESLPDADFAAVAIKPQPKPQEVTPEVKQNSENTVKQNTQVVKLCQNCGFTLDGPFCGRCGQTEQSTIRFFGSVLIQHIEDIFGFDSRAGRTLFPLIFRPGFLTNAYLKGRRVHYVPPLRLYLFVSIIFFIVLGFFTDGSVKELKQLQQQNNASSVYDLNTDIAELKSKMAQKDYKLTVQDQQKLLSLQHKRDATKVVLQQQIDDLTVKINELKPNDSMDGLSQKELKAINALELERKGLELNLSAHPKWEQLKQIEEQLADLNIPFGGDEVHQQLQAEKEKLLAYDVTQLASEQQEKSGIRKQSERVQIFANVDIDWLSEDSNERLKKFFEQMNEKAKVAIEQDAGPLIKQVLNVLPQLMFFLLPIFALILKIFYLFAKRYYMEHLTVALHSHAFIFVVLMMLAGLSTLFEQLPKAEVMWKEVVEYAMLILLIWVPMYLLLMQKRVYQQGWFFTVFKFALVGWTYTILMSVAVLVALFWGLAAM